MLFFTDYSTLFCITFGLMLLFTFIMKLMSLHFYTKDVVIKKFSIMDLEMPATAQELVNLIRGLYKLPAERSKKAVAALKGQLYIDFLFMPFAYGSVFLFCMLVSTKVQLFFGVNFFIIFAWLQAVPWLCDIIENIYLLRKIKPDPVLSSATAHTAYLCMEIIKWGIALSAAICSVAAACYIWLSGNYAQHTLYYLPIIAGEVILFVILSISFANKKKQQHNNTAA